LDPVKPHLRSRLHSFSATRVVVTTIGVIFGLAGFNHGFFEFLQWNTLTDGLTISTAAVLNVAAFIAGFGHELHRMDQYLGGTRC
jgi:hypothetical protein